ncbi:MAG TPA: metallophosphoesterase family protein [Bacteroidales bacterium]|nr:metallophosphoesterase family protein [Bacteroidales bacterium]
MRIGLLSDTHGWIHPGLVKFFAECDEIWHAGDIGNLETADSLSSIKPLRAVYGNIDNAAVRSEYPEKLRFRAGDVNVFITHIGGTPGNYDRRIRDELMASPPDLFICGHSHIAKIMFDKKGGFLYVNPGAAGYIGFHKIMTAARFTIDSKSITGMEIIELGERGRVEQ